MKKQEGLSKSQRRRIAADEQIAEIRRSVAAQEKKESEVASELAASRDSLTSGPAGTSDDVAKRQAQGINRSKK